MSFNALFLIFLENTETLISMACAYKVTKTSIVGVLIISHLITSVCMLAQSLSRVQLFVTQWPIAFQAPLSMGFSRQEYWSGQPFLLQLRVKAIPKLTFTHQQFGTHNTFYYTKKHYIKGLPSKCTTKLNQHRETDYICNQLADVRLRVILVYLYIPLLPSPHPQLLWKLGVTK